MVRQPTVEDLIQLVRREAGDEVLDQLATARAVATGLAASGDAMLGYFVDRARRSGCNWVDISDALGVSKQAVHKRFAASVSELTYGRMTPRARRSLDSAAERARSLGHRYVGTEHLLLGLYAAPESVAAKILTAAGIGVHEAEAAVLALTPRRTGTVEDEPRRTQRANSVLSNAVNEALELGHNYVGTEHILLGLYRVPAGRAAQILTRLGLDEPAARRQVIDVLTGLGPSAPDKEEKR
jgi:hypothetical protein